MGKLYPEIRFPIAEGDEGFGLVADEDVLWEADYRETKSEVADRLENFLRLLYRTTSRKVCCCNPLCLLLGASRE